MDYAQLGLHAVLTLVGSGLGTTIVGAIYRRKFDAQLEHQKAILQRASRVHERQVEVLARIYHRLWESHAFLQLMSKSFTMSNEKPEEYPARFAKALSEARDEFFANRILAPDKIVSACDAFFDKTFQWQLARGSAEDPLLPMGEERAKIWAQTRAIAYEEIPSLLREIEREARHVVFSEAGV